MERGEVVGAFLMSYFRKRITVNFVISSVVAYARFFCFFFLHGILWISLLEAAPLLKPDSITQFTFIENPLQKQWVDVNRTFSDKEVQQFSPDSFKTAPGVYTYLSLPEAAYWSALNIQRPAPEQKWVLEIITPQTEYVKVFFPVGDTAWISHESGYLMPWDNRVYRHKNFVFDVPGNLDQRRSVLVKVISSNGVLLIYKLQSQQNFTAYALREYIALGLFYGTIILLIIYNLILFFTLREWVYLFYCLSLACAAGNTMSNDGLGFAFVWPNHPDWSAPLGLRFFALGFLLFYTAYAFFFFSREDRLYKLRYALLFPTTIYLCYYGLRLILTGGAFQFDRFFILPFLSIFIIYAWAWYRGFHSARFFLLGNAFALVAILIDQLRLLGIINGTVFTVYSFNAGIVLESLTLSLAMADRLHFFRKQEARSREQLINELRQNERLKQQLITQLQEKEKLKDQVNRELENKVAERTAELSQEKQKLSDLVGQLEKMSIELDKDNWKLKRIIREEKHARLEARELPYAEFIQLYPTPELCLELMANWKWQQGFKCRNCGYGKASLLPDQKGKKCSKCGKAESVLAHTFFHGLKFPLNQGFYLFYRFVQNPAASVDELAQITGLSAPTVRQFRSRTEDYLSRWKAHYKISKPDTWLQLLEQALPGD